MSNVKCRTSDGSLRLVRDHAGTTLVPPWDHLGTTLGTTWVDAPWTPGGVVGAKPQIEDQKSGSEATIEAVGAKPHVVVDAVGRGHTGQIHADDSATELRQRKADALQAARARAEKPGA